jgi:hypothetical protein
MLFRHVLRSARSECGVYADCPPTRQATDQPSAALSCQRGSSGGRLVTCLRRFVPRDDKAQTGARPGADERGVKVIEEARRAGKQAFPREQTVVVLTLAALSHPVLGTNAVRPAAIFSVRRISPTIWRAPAAKGNVLTLWSI